MPEANPNEQNDRVLITACGLALLTLLPVALRQLGAIEHLPDPPSDLFDSDGITASPLAHPLGLPDSLLGIGSYAMTLALAVASVRARTRDVDDPLPSRLLGAKLLVDSGAAAFNSVRQVRTFGKLCSWCMGTVLATAVMAYAGRSHISGLKRRHARGN